MATGLRTPDQAKPKQASKIIPKLGFTNSLVTGWQQGNTTTTTTTTTFQVKRSR